MITRGNQNETRLMLRAWQRRQCEAHFARRWRICSSPAFVILMLSSPVVNTTRTPGFKHACFPEADRSCRCAVWRPTNQAAKNANLHSSQIVVSQVIRSGQARRSGYTTYLARGHSTRSSQSSIVKDNRSLAHNAYQGTDVPSWVS